MSEIRDIIKKIDSLQNMSELDEKTIAEENGYAESVARDRDIKKRLKTTQLRKIFDRVKTIERDLNEDGWDAVQPDFYMLRPELAYAMARKLIPEQFFMLMDACMKQVDKGNDPEQKKENYAKFVRFLEAIVAYHKYHEVK